MKQFKNKALFAAAFSSILLFSCESDDPVIENDGEVITDVVLTFVEVNQTITPIGEPFSVKASDPQGIEVGGTPSIETINLEKGKTYLMKIEVLNSIEGEDITEEILEEADEHQFFFLGQAFSSNIISISYNDPSGKNLGLENIFSTTTSPGTNNTTWRVVLRHDLDKNYPGATNPNFENYVEAGGETDLDITFPLILE